ncbi:MAG: two-component response regulator [Rhodospirillales bacterium]|nr:two-component response regulator [Rhodospirillales bacterium]
MPKTAIVSVVDDDESVRISLAALVRSLGHIAHGFASAEAFLASGKAEQTDCLITDVQMPGMSGLDLQHQIIGRGGNVPMIFITAFPDDRLRDHVLAAGALGLLAKPYDGDILVSLIDTALSSRP